MGRPQSNATGEASVVKRWIGACILALGGTALFMALVIRPDAIVRNLPQPFMELGYLILPPEPREKPKPVKPLPARVSEPIPEPVQEPPATPPVAPSDPASSGPADVPAPVIESPKAPSRQVPDVRLQNASQLDNTQFTPIVNIKPEYPSVAYKANIEGYVDVDLVINEHGRVESFSLAGIYGHQSFGNATAKVVPKWRFPPPRIKGQRVRVSYLFRVNFSLD